jgi:glucose-6-phosphate dehydrogenase assembly protein OpcA
VEDAVTSHESGKVSEALTNVERELAALWKPQENEPPKARVCTGNLVLLSSSKHQARTIETADALHITEVSRTFVVTLDPKLPPWAVQTNVSARCRKGEAGLLCAERIDLDLGAATSSRAASIVATLSMPEVPTTLVVMESAPAILVSALARDAARLVIDTSQMSLEDADSIARSTRAHLVDLAWERLYPYRNAIAAFFDAPDLRRAVTAVRKVTVTTIPTEGGIPAPTARLLLGWLSSRLGWRFVSERSAIDRLHAAVDIDLAWHMSPGRYPPGTLVGVEIEALLGDAEARFSFFHEPAAPCMHVAHVAEGVSTSSRLVSINALEPDELLDQAVMQGIPDRALREALASAVAFPPKPKPPEVSS